MENRVLLVDDNEFMLSLMSHILDNQGYMVQTSTRARGLFEQIHTYHPNLIILDAQLPDGDGRDLCRQIKQSEGINHIPVVMCSGLEDIGESLNQQGPPDGVLKKPFDMHQLINLLQDKLPLAA